MFVAAGVKGAGGGGVSGLDVEGARTEPVHVDWVTALFLVGGVLLIASEALHTALVPVFLGVAALIVAALRGLGVLESVPLSLLVWSLTSVGLALPLRPLAKKFVGGAVKRFDRSDEVKDAYGEIVEVVEAVDDVSNNGRIRFQGTTWAARSTDGILAPGTKVKLFAKDKLVWVVEPLSLLDEDQRVPTNNEAAAATNRNAEVAAESPAEARAKGK